MNYRVILLAFPFVDSSSQKKRPAAIIKTISHSKLGNLHVVAMITSQTKSIRLKYDVVIQDWRDVPLPKPSLLRLAKVVTIHDDLILKDLGNLSDSDSNSVSKVLSECFS